MCIFWDYHLTSTILYKLYFSLFTGHMLGVAASWVVQVSIDLYRFFRSIFRSNDEDSDVDTTEQVRILGQKVALTSIRCSSSLVFASIGAGIGATLVRPSLGQWIGKIVNTCKKIITSCLNCVRLIHNNLTY